MAPDLAAVRTVYLVARRDFLTRVRTRFFVIGTALLVILLVGSLVLQANVFSRFRSTTTIAFDGSTQALAQPLLNSAKAQGVTVRTRTEPNLSKAQADVRSGTLDAAVYGDPASPTVAVKDALDPQLAAILSGLVREAALERALAAQGVSGSAVSAAVAAAAIHVEPLDPGAAQRGERIAAATIVTVLLYVALVMYGQIVAGGVVEEKANRIVEILLAAIRPRELLFGKVIGVGLVGLLQLLILGVAGQVAVRQTHIVALPSLALSSVAGGILWFVLGFMLYALLYAAAGSLASRQEDVGAVASPLTMLLVGTYLVFFWVVANPTNPWAAVLSVLPPFAPVLMPARMASGDATWWQVLLAVALIVPAILAVNAAGARIYANSIMRTGARVRLAEAWRGQS